MLKKTIPITDEAVILAGLLPPVAGVDAGAEVAPVYGCYKNILDVSKLAKRLWPYIRIKAAVDGAQANNHVLFNFAFVLSTNNFEKA